MRCHSTGYQVPTRLYATAALQHGIPGLAGQMVVEGYSQLESGMPLGWGWSCELCCCTAGFDEASAALLQG